MRLSGRTRHARDRRTPRGLAYTRRVSPALRAVRRSLRASAVFFASWLVLAGAVPGAGPQRAHAAGRSELPVRALSVREVLGLAPDKIRALTPADRAELRARIAQAARTQPDATQFLSSPGLDSPKDPVLAQLRAIVAQDRERQQRRQEPLLTGVLISKRIQQFAHADLFDAQPPATGKKTELTVPPSLRLREARSQPLRALVEHAATFDPAKYSPLTLVPAPGMPLLLIFARDEHMLYVNPVLLELMADQPVVEQPSDLRTHLPDGGTFPPPDLYTSRDDGTKPGPGETGGGGSAPEASSGGACGGCLSPWNDLCSSWSRSCQRCDRDCTDCSKQNAACTRACNESCERGCGSCGESCTRGCSSSCKSWGKSCEDCNQTCSSCNSSYGQCSKDCGACNSQCGQCSNDCNRCNSQCGQCGNECNQCNSQCNQCGNQCNQCNGQCNQCQVGVAALPMPPGPVPEPSDRVRAALGVRGGIAFMLPPLLFLFWRRRLRAKASPA